jgi:hypothetical protein
METIKAQNRKYPYSASDLHQLAAGYKSPLLCSAVFLMAVLSYCYTIGYGFVWDDKPFIINNIFISDISNFFKVFVSRDAVGADMSYDNPYYRPITTASFMLNSFFSGNNPAGYHAVNVCLHAVVCVLLFKTAEFLFNNVWAAFVSTIIFCLHPANLEPIVWISARADLICGIFLLSSFLLYLKFSKESKAVFYYLSLIAFGLAVFSKIVAILLPFILLADVKREKKSVSFVAPYFVIGLLFWIARDLVVVKDSFYGSTWDIRFATAPTMVVNYILNTVFPFGLKPFYDLSIKTAFSDPLVILSWLAVLLIAAALPLCYRYSRIATFGVLWYFLFLFPTSGFYMLFPGTLIADRYLYIPLMGLSFFICYSLNRINASISRKFSFAQMASAVAAFIIGFSFYNFDRSTIWKDNPTFWKYALTVESLDPGFKIRNYSQALMEINRNQEAYDILMALKAKEPNNPYLDYFIARALIGMANYEEAIVHSRNAVKKYPVNPRFIALLGKISMLMGQYDDSVQLCSYSLRMDPWQKDATETLRKLNKLHMQ